MKLETIRDLLRCEVLAGTDALDTDVDTAVASDAMSVVLACPHPGAVMITGLANIQSVRTAQVSYLAAVIYVRGSRPNGDAIKLAADRKMVLLASPLGMFEACGVLFDHGIKGGV
jgi:hypothetical protein